MKHIKLQLTDIVDINAVQNLMDKIWKVSGFLGAILDVDGTVLVAAGWQDICTKFHRQHPETRARCHESDTNLTRHLHEQLDLPEGGYLESRCKNGLVDIGIPFVFEGCHLANIFFGQFLYEPPDEEFFRRQARQFGFDENAYLEALKKVPILSRQKVVEVLELNKAMVDLLTHMGVEKLRQIQAERSLRLASLGELAIGVAHEINTPNAVLMHNTDFLAQFFEEALPVISHFLKEQDIENLAGMDPSTMDKEIRQMLADMKVSTKRIIDIVKDLKQFVKSEPEQMFGLVDLNEVVSVAVRLAGNLLRKSTLSYEISYAPDLPRVNGISQQLEQVVINLLTNACQALGDKEGGVFVATYFDETLQHCVVEVRDEGEGIDPEVLPHITEPFFTTKHQDGGTGLGLSVSARIVREHHGKLEFFSLLGQGTTVRLSLPSVDEGGKL
ncbi:MAG: sensor histidine kinase [Pedobacter sp.]